MRINRLTGAEIIVTGLMAVFFLASEYLINLSTREYLYGFALSAPIILLAVCLPMIAAKFVFLKMRLSKMAEHKAPLRSPYYRSNIIVAAAQSVVSMFATSVSTFALVMSLFIAFGMNSESLLQALHNEHLATYAIFPALDLIYLISQSWKRR